MGTKIKLETLLGKARENIAGGIQVLFTGIVKGKNRATYYKSEEMLNELNKNKSRYILDSKIDSYSKDDIFFKPTSFLEKDQFEKLSKLYRILPDAVPAPITKVRRNDGKEIGYIMSKVNGETMSSYLESIDESLRNKENDRLVTEISMYIKVLSENGVGHGDIHRRNIIVYGGKPFLLDPFSVARCDNWYIKRDYKNLEKLKSIRY